jgi:hypothetical protein
MIKELQSYNIMDLGFKLRSLSEEISELESNITYPDSWKAMFSSFNPDLDAESEY